MNIMVFSLDSTTTETPMLWEIDLQVDRLEIGERYGTESNLILSQHFNQSYNEVDYSSHSTQVDNPETIELSIVKLHSFKTE